MKKRSRQALLITDMLSEYRFAGWRSTLAAARRIAPRIARLAGRARKAGVPVIYVNDMPADWDSDRRGLVQRCAAPGARGADLITWIAPAAGDRFIFKPRHSAFFGTGLAELLYTLGTQQLILTGITSHQCVLFTAMDGYVRNFELLVPRDCIDGPRVAQVQAAAFLLRESVRARMPRAAQVRFRTGG